MSEKKYYWLKLQKGFFDKKEIKKLRRIAGGDTYTVIYLKLLLLSLPDDGKLFFDGVEKTFAEELALTLDEDVENVEITVSYLMSVGLMREVNPVESELTQVPEMIGSETASAERMRRHRQRQKLLENSSESGTKSSQSDGVASHSDSDVTERYTEIDIDIEIESDKESNTIKDSIRGTGMPRTTVRQKVIDKWNELPLPNIKSINEGTNRYIMLNARVKEYGADAVLEAIGNIGKSGFLLGQNQRGWTATFDWFIKPNNFVKVLEGNYADNVPDSKPKASSPWDNISDDVFEQLQGEDE